MKNLTQFFVTMIDFYFRSEYIRTQPKLMRISN